MNRRNFLSVLSLTPLALTIPKRLLLPETAQPKKPEKPAPPIDYPTIEFTFIDLIGPNRLYYIPCKQYDWNVWDNNWHVAPGYFNTHSIDLAKLEMAAFWSYPDGKFRNASIIMGGQLLMLKHHRSAQRMYELCREKEHYGCSLGRTVSVHWTEHTIQHFINNNGQKG